MSLATRDSKQTAAVVKPGSSPQGRGAARRIRPIVSIGISWTDLERRVKMAFVRSQPGGKIGSLDGGNPIAKSPMALRGNQCRLSLRERMCFRGAKGDFTGKVFAFRSSGRAPDTIPLAAPLALAHLDFTGQGGWPPRQPSGPGAPDPSQGHHPGPGRSLRASGRNGCTRPGDRGAPSRPKGQAWAGVALAGCADLSQRGPLRSGLR